MISNKSAIPPTWTTGWTDVFETGTWRSAKPIYQRRLSPCQNACPLNGEISNWIGLMQKGEWEQAWLTITKKNPFPAICGRVCHHPCESNCNREEYDGAVAVNALEQFIGDVALEHGWSLTAPLTEVQGQKIAVIGGGPAGLSCAYQLRRLGFRVTIFEAQSELGGILRYGIPSYRLSKSIVDGEINRLLSLGFDVRTNIKILPTELTNLLQEYAAVFWATGAPIPGTLPQLPADGAQVMDSLCFLLQVNRGEPPVTGHQVAVIGGGSVAIDAARTARRLGSQVKILALEARPNLPAQPGEVVEAESEGVIIIPETMVLSAKNLGKSLELDCVQVSLKVEPENNIDPVIISGTEFTLTADTVIVAVGQKADLRDFPALISVQNSLIAVRTDQTTSVPGLFAGGDVTSAARYVSEAIASGMRAADGILNYLGYPVTNEVHVESDTVKFNEINSFYFPMAARAERELVNVAQRLTCFQEVKVGLSINKVVAEAERCFNCGQCLQCDNCYYFCPDMAVAKNAGAEASYSILDQYCKGCGLCVEECPRGAIRLKEERR